MHYKSLLPHVVLSAIAMILSTNMAKAQTDYSHYYVNTPVKLEQPTLPTIPNLTVSITDFGAKGDGQTLNTEAFEKAIAHLTEKGGGHLTIPAGIWLTGPIELKSNIDLHLERQALLYFSPDKSLYLVPKGKSSRVYPGIRANDVHDVSITGEGIIDGNGAQWRPVKRSKVSDTEWKEFKAMGGIEKQNGSLWYPWQMKSGIKDIAASPEAQEKMRNDLIRIVNCQRLLIKGVTVQNSPKFHVHPFNSTDVIIDGITVRCPWNAQNGDAIDISDCHRCLIVNSTVDAGDDGLCMKSGAAKPTNLVNGCQDILIEANTVYHAHGGFVIGSESISGMNRIVVRNCRFAGTDTGLRFKSGIGRGGKTSDIYINDIMMTDIKDEAIIFQCDYVNKPAGSAAEKEVKEETEIPEFADIHISNVVCRTAKRAISAHGIANHRCVYGITINNCTFTDMNSDNDIDTATTEITIK